MRVALATHSRGFATRQRAVDLVRTIVEEVGDQEVDSLGVDFTGVSVVSGSFADEFVRSLSQGLRGHRVKSVKFEGMSSLVSERIRWAVEQTRSIDQARAESRTPTLVA